jgi:hypothetical protein
MHKRKRPSIQAPGRSVLAAPSRPKFADSRAQPLCRKRRETHPLLSEAEAKTEEIGYFPTRRAHCTPCSLYNWRRHTAGHRTVNGHWIGVACAEHVRRGREDGFMQLGHGKVAPLRRVKPGDRIVYYSPTVTLGGKDRLQAFTAIGVVKDREPYLFDIGKGFKPYRRDVKWAKAKDAPIHPLLDELEFTAGKSNWGYKFRFGLFPISEADFRAIAKAMGAAV